MAFINEHFMLNNETGKHLYHDFAKDMPIYDYHCHLDPKQISDNVACDNITDLWLSGDHYKWRAMHKALKNSILLAMHHLINLKMDRNIRKFSG